MLEPGRSRLVMTLAALALGAAVVAEALIRLEDLPGATHLVGIGLLYIAWWIALTGAVLRVSGSPLHWFTILLPVSGGVLILLGEIAIATGRSELGETPSTYGFLFMFGAPVLTTLMARRNGFRWKSGLAAWSLLLYQATISLAGLSGIPFGTYGDESRADEMVFYAIVPPLLALLVAIAAAPRLATSARLTAGGLVLMAVPAVFLSTSDGGPGLLAAVAAFGGLVLIVDAVGRELRARPGGVDPLVVTDDVEPPLGSQTHP